MNRVKQCTSAAFFMVLSWSAAAHPHSFISLQSEPVVKDGLLSAFKMRWTMDEITSSDLLYDAGNAKPGSAVWKKLAAEVMANVLGQHYFSELWHNGQRVKFDNRPDGYGLERDGLQAVLTFTLPLATPQPPLPGRRLPFPPSTRPTTSICFMTRIAIFPARRAAAACKATVMTPNRTTKCSHAPSRWIKRMRRRRIWRWEAILPRR